MFAPHRAREVRAVLWPRNNKQAHRASVRAARREQRLTAIRAVDAAKHIVDRFTESRCQALRALWLGNYDCILVGHVNFWVSRSAPCC